ncbi:MAG: Ig-like domain-containing protein [Oscillospiraceae bacterium]|nr:Ig-like domain-containing protein [Oscillospiraceae bacterium]
MKRFFSILLAVLLAAMPAAAEPEGGTAEAEPAGAVVELADTESFLHAIASQPGGSFRLTADLDLGALDWTPLPFSGSLDGGGHTLYNLRVTRAGKELRTTGDGNLKPYDTSFAGLFSVLEGATVQNLNLAGANVSVDAQNHCFAGLLAGGMFDSSVRGCVLEGRVRLNNYAVNAGVGGVAGYGSGTVADCDVTAELVFEDRNFDARCEEFLGGVLACGIGELTGNRVWIDGWDSCHGYVHNGGLVGMYYHCGMEAPAGAVSNNFIRGQITFFEDNWDRRAYCSAVIGETLSYPAAQLDNESEFTSNEVWEYDRVLLPEQCETPEYAETVTPPGCGDWGCTEHRCAVCGYGWTDDYTPPRHTPGDWEKDGEDEVLRCALCGAELDRREALEPEPEPEASPVPEAVPEPEPEAASCVVEPAALTLHYRETGQLTAATSPEGTAVRWESTNPSVVTVDAGGKLYAVGHGRAEIVCAAGDGSAEGRCAVTVDYSFGQWMIVIFLFGWLWY